METSCCRIKSYKFGENGVMCLNKVAVLVTDTDKSKTIVLPLKRWVKFVKIFHEICEVLLAFTRGEQVDYMKHIGGGFQVCVNTPYRCVNIRKFCQSASGMEIQPTKHGIAMRFDDWYSFIDANHTLVEENPHLKDIEQCGPHSGQFIESEGETKWEQDACSECYPFTDVPPSAKIHRKTQAV